ncbi:MAG TPA: DnaJ domain-containing protein [Ktedonobacteraceae bacterium]|nr:DnaJ domain-containing protein [Ktedonobacteraceae bacterium]
MDTLDNYYAILGVPPDADSDTLKRAYRQLARRYHPDLAGPEGALEMKRINRAYDVLSDPQKRLNYDTIIGGAIDLRKGGITRPRPVPRKFDPSDDIEFAGLSIFSTKGPLRAGPKLHSQLGVISALSSVQYEAGLCIAAGSLDGKGLIWHPGAEIEPGKPQARESQHTMVSFAADGAFAVESLRELRFSASGGLVSGWGRSSLHVWQSHDGALLWSYGLSERAVSAHYSIDVALKETNGAREVWMALPLLRDDPRAPRSLGVRGTDVVRHVIGDTPSGLSSPLVCAEDEIEKRQFWAIRLRALAQDTRALLTLSCAHVPDEQDEMVVIRRWDTQARSKTRFREVVQPQITGSLIAGLCANCTPPYAVTPDMRALAFVHANKSIRIHDTTSGLFSELPSGTMGASSRLAISPDAQWVAVAREDSEVNEGVIDLWSVPRSEVAQKLYHPWQISALHFAPGRLLVSLTDGTIQVWQL